MFNACLIYTVYTWLCAAFRNHPKSFRALSRLVFPVHSSSHSILAMASAWMPQSKELIKHSWYASIVDICWYNHQTIHSWYMLIYVDICWYMLIYVDICWYMLIYVDICWYGMIYVDIYIFFCLSMNLHPSPCHLPTSTWLVAATTTYWAQDHCKSLRSWHHAPGSVSTPQAVRCFYRCFDRSIPIWLRISK